MAMTKKHYEAVAERFQQQLKDMGELHITAAERAIVKDQLERLAIKLSMTFEYENARFSTTRFLDACGF